MSSAKLEWVLPQKRDLVGGDLLAQTLAHLGVEVSFGLHGGHLDSFLIGCDLIGIKLIDTRHEAVAVQAAEGYAKIAGKPGCCFVTANSGFCNALPGIATAYADRSPVFVITSSQPLREAEINGMQGFLDQVPIAKSLSKFAHRVTSVEEIPRIVTYAYKVCQTGAPGPVLLDFPIDILFHPPRMHAISYGSVMSDAAFSPSPDPVGLSTLAEIWKSAQRPVIVTGTGVAQLNQRSSTLLQLAERTQTPIFHSQKYLPMIPATHPLRGGHVATLAKMKFIKSQQPDLIVLIGVRPSWLLGGRSGAMIPHNNRKLVQVDLDGCEIGRFLPVDLGFVSDSAKFIEAFIKVLDSLGKKIDGNGAWIQEIQEVKNLPSMYEGDEEKSPDGRLHPFWTMRTICQALPVDSIFIIDGAEAGIWTMECIDLAKPSTAMVATGMLGFLGNGWGYSLGAAVAAPDKLIVNIQGDGSAGFHIQELDTFSRHRLNVLTVVMNNSWWGMSIAGQNLLYGDDEPARMVTKLGENTRYDIVAQGFGCKHAVAKNSLAEVKEGIKTLLESDGPGLLNAIISEKPVTIVTQGLINRTEDKDTIVIPYYENLPKPIYPADGKHIATEA